MSGAVRKHRDDLWWRSVDEFGRRQTPDVCCAIKKASVVIDSNFYNSHLCLVDDCGGTLREPGPARLEFVRNLNVSGGTREKGQNTKTKAPSAVP